MFLWKVLKVELLYFISFGSGEGVLGGGGHWGSAPFATRSRARGAHALKGRNIVPTELAVGCSFFTCLNFSFKLLFFFGVGCGMAVPNQLFGHILSRNWTLIVHTKIAALFGFSGI